MPGVARGGVRAADGGDALMRPPHLDAPSTLAGAEMPRTAEEVAGIIRDAAAARQGLRLLGHGSWPAVAAMVQAARDVSLHATRGIIEYNPADLTITVGAGTTIAELDEATRAHGQWCPLAPPGFAAVGTVGATIATASEGPYAATLGKPRSFVLGLECVDGTGRIIRAGGRVVKNVAGFDLTRTMVGAWGTLGAITRLHLRLRALPAVSEMWGLMLPVADAPRLAEYLRGPLAPMACVPFPPHGAPPGIDRVPYLVRIGGNAAFVAASRAALRSLGAVTEQDASNLEMLANLDAPAPPTIRWRWDALSLRLRDRFDPHRILNPGLLGEPA